MRFQVNEVLPVVAIIFAGVDDSTNLMFHPYYPWFDMFSKIERIEFEHLTVTEHHRVRNEWAPKDAEPDCDGFILKSSKDEIWHNQYPYASYGQTSDAADRMFDRHLEEGEFVQWYDKNKNVPCQYRLLSDYMVNIKRGIWQREEQTNLNAEELAHTEALSKHLQDLCDSYEQQFGKKVVFDKHLIGKGSEEERWLKGWWKVRFV